MAKIIREQAAAIGVPEEQAVKIAWCESNHRQFEANGEILRGRLSPSDVGIFQISEYYHLDTSRKLGFNIYTTEGNIGYALWLLKAEGDKHWNPSKNCWDAQP